MTKIALLKSINRVLRMKNIINTIDIFSDKRVSCEDLKLWLYLRFKFNSKDSGFFSKDKEFVILWPVEISEETGITILAIRKSFKRLRSIGALYTFKKSQQDVFCRPVDLWGKRKESVPATVIEQSVIEEYVEQPDVYLNYLVAWKGENVSFIKYGVSTKRSFEKRLELQKKKSGLSFKVIETWERQSKQDSYQKETMVKRVSYPFVDSRIFPDGFTETLEKTNKNIKMVINAFS